MLQPSQTDLICCPAVLTNGDPLVLIFLVVPSLVMVLSFEYKKGWYRPSYSVDAGNQGYLLAIARLDSKWLYAPLRRGDDFDGPSDADLEACLVEVVGVFV